MLAIAVVLCSYFLSRKAVKYGLSSEVIYDLVFFIVAFGIIGARLFYIFLNFRDFTASPADIIMIQNGGLAWQGALVGGFFTLLWYIRRKNLKTLMLLDLTAPYIALGQSIGRIGCFLSGCCYGKKVAWGIYFPIYDAHLHPTQLYLSFGDLIIFFILNSYQKKRLGTGRVFTLYILFATVLRFIVEFYRGDHFWTYGGLSIYQFVCLVLFIAAAIIMKKLKVKKV